MQNFIKKKANSRFLILSMVLSLIVAMLSPSLQSVASAKSINTEGKFDHILDNPQQIIHDDDYSSEDLKEVKQYLYENFGIETSRVLEPGEVEQTKVVSAVLKSLKALAPVFKHGGTVVGFLVKPFSKKYGVLVKKNSRKIGNALSKLESGTKIGVENALVNAGVSRSDAKSIVKVLFWII